MTAISEESATRFETAFPEYARTALLDEIRRTEYGYLDREGHVYLDYTGAGLAAVSQYRSHAERLADGCFGNPHSANPASQASTDLVEACRLAVLDYFHADPREYTAVFTANATAACRLVGEAYPFDPQSRFLLTFDNHNSVNGIREHARRARSLVRYVPGSGPELRVDESVLEHALADAAVYGRGKRAGLFAYPGQSNFSGVRHPLRWVALAQRHGFDVLLDAAALVPTTKLDLSLVHPEFVTVSWYKLFGYPTGIGCLIARREALERLNRPWFSGGTIHAVSVQGDWHVMADGATAFEDGTVNFHSIPDVEYGLRWLRGLGIETIGTRVRCLTGWMLEGLSALTHSDGSPLTRIYGPLDTVDRGGTVSFNFLDVRGRVVDERIVQTDAGARRISVRTGCFCNPGAGELAFDIGGKDLNGQVSQQVQSIDQYLQALRLPSGGAVRASLGLASNKADVDRFLEFAAATYRDRMVRADGLPPRESC